MSLNSIFGINVAYASGSPAAVTDFVNKIVDLIINPLIILLFVIALAYFLFGVVKFISNADNPSEREVGQSHVMWGLVGMCIMFGVFGIIGLIKRTFGIV